MAQFDVRRNGGRHRETIPFVVVVRRRVVVPLASLGADGQQIIAALDELLSRAWR
jgi:hypothetical protein